MRVARQKFPGLTILFCLCIVLTGVLSGCKAAPQPSAVTADSKWFASSSLLMSDYELVNRLLASAGLKDANDIAGLYLFKDRGTEGFSSVLNTGEQYFLSNHDSAGNVIQTLPLEGLSGLPLAAFRRADSSLCVITEVTDQETWSILIRYHILSEDDKAVISSGEIDELKNMSVNAVDSDQDQNVYFLLGSRIITLDLSTFRSKSIPLSDSGIFDIAYMNGRLYGISEKDGSGHLFEIDPKTGNASELMSFSSESEFLPVQVIGAVSGSESKVYLMSETSVAEYNPQARVLTMLVQGSQKGLSLLPIDFGFLVLFENTFLALGETLNFDPQEGVNESIGLFRIELLDHPTDKSTIRLGLFGMEGTDDLDYLATLFNQNNPDYEIEIVRYGNYEENFGENFSFDDIRRAREDLIASILSSTEPADVYYLPLSDTEILAERNMLSDISDIVDEAISHRSSDYAMNVIESCKREGRMNWFTPFFVVSGFLFDQSRLQEIHDFSLEGMIEYATAADLQPVSGLFSLFPIIEKEFTDPSAETDSQELIDLLEMSLVSAQKDGDPLIDQYSLSNFHAFVYEAQRRDSEFTLIGYPDGEKNPPFLSATFVCSIPAQSGNPEGAAEFIRFMLSPTIQNMSSVFAGEEMPVLLSAFDAQTELIAKQYRDPMTDSETQLFVHNSAITEAMSNMPIQEKEDLIPFPTDDRWQDSFKRLALEAEGLYVEDYSLFLILYEEYSYFFNGQKSAEETAKVIQNRVSVYMAERE
ncbi:MAG: hypothetical protein JW817_03420 [Clostridiales bacterium]|nr:hypothetical protein [Clostridiales bacterium]